ncbi:MAG: FAD-dependent oxidoreductase [Xenococcaceae cyanobacterium]
MLANTNDVIKNLALIGGGHSHAIALKLFGSKPIPSVRLILITDVAKTPYSGMLPGHVAGFYSYDETHIDLCRLARSAGAELYLDKAIGLDLEKNLVICKHRQPVSFDYLSIDIGSTPATASIPGANLYAIPAKPVPQFLDAWNQIIDRAIEQPEKQIAIAIVGGGAGGVELAFNMQSRLQKILTKTDLLSIDLLHRGEKLLPKHNDRVSKQVEKIALDRGIQLHLKEAIASVSADKINCQSGLTVEADYIFWVTQASAPTWIKESGLATDDRGFILVGDTLQSVSHAHVFAVGDIATMQDRLIPKAGVFAVRQGKPLFTNWERSIAKKPLQLYIPQKRYLSLIGTGDKNAIANWGKLAWRSPLLWYWKDWIDRRFMNMFS